MSTQPEDALQSAVKALLERFRPDSFPEGLTIHAERETGNRERPCLVLLCENPESKHRRLFKCRLVLRGLVRPPATNAKGAEAGEPDTAAADTGAWHGAAVQVIEDHRQELGEALMALGWRLRIFTLRESYALPDGDRCWQYNRAWSVSLEESS